MDFFAVIAVLCMIVNAWNFIVAFTLLTVALINYRRCLNFSTLLVCNTAVATGIYAVTNITTVMMMFIWDREIDPKIDPLCSTRAFLYHSSVAAIHHSFMLQAIHRFCRVKGSSLLGTNARKFGLVIIQWLFDFTFPIPALATGNLKKLTIDNLCFVNLSRPEFFIYMAILAYFSSDIVVNVIYKRLVHHLREVSSNINMIQERKMRRDLIVVRRIILLNAPMAIVGLPTLVVVITTIISVDLLPHKLLRVAFLLTNIPMSIVLMILIWFTPDLRASINLCPNRIRAAQAFTVTRIARKLQQPSSNR